MGATARAVDGPATEAALAEAFGVRRRALKLVNGATSRTKVVAVAGSEQAVLDQLLARQAPPEVASASAVSASCSS